MRFGDRKIKRQIHRLWEGARLPVGRGLCSRLRARRPRCPGCRGLHLGNRRFSPESPGRAAGWAWSGARTAARGGGRFPAPSPPRGRQEGADVAPTPEPQPPGGVETQPLRALRQGPRWRRGGAAGGGVGGQRAAPPPAGRPLCQSPIVRRSSDYAGLWCPGRQQETCPPGPGCLFIWGEEGRAGYARRRRGSALAPARLL